MEALLAESRKSGCASEIYGFEQTYDTLRFENGGFKNITSSMQSGTSLRLIKNNLLGFAYTRNQTHHETLIANALASLQVGVIADFTFPYAAALPRLATYDPGLENLSGAEIADECLRVIDFLKKLTGAQIDVAAGRIFTTVRILNTSGTDVETRSTLYHFDLDIVFPGTCSSISHRLYDKRFTGLDEESMRRIAELFNAARQEVSPAPQRMPVLFMPGSMHTLIWRVASAVNGRSVYNKSSPVAGKLNERIFDPKLGIYDDPLDDRYISARPFDDEGTPGRRLDIVENGRLKNFYYDLYYAAKMKTVSTGHGYRSAMWSTDPVSLKPAPGLNNLFFSTGDRSFDQLVKEMKRGIIVHGCLGAHSGNITNGDFSIGLAPGLYVEDGRITGRVKNAMVSGNIFDLMTGIIGIENTLQPSREGYMPAILFESAMVALQ